MGGLERNRMVNRDREVLERILALLLALAALVDRAAGLPILKRRHLIAMLGRGEAEARMLIVEMASGAADETAVTASAAGDAPRLAASFRMLALVLNALLAQAWGEPPRRQALQAGSPRRKPRRPGGSRPFAAPAAPDTS
jgi:hypothetical protein